jgi:hypothetical protein
MKKEERGDRLPQAQWDDKTSLVSRTKIGDFSGLWAIMQPSRVTSGLPPLLSHVSLPPPAGNHFRDNCPKEGGFGSSCVEHHQQIDDVCWLEVLGRTGRWDTPNDGNVMSLGNLLHSEVRKLGGGCRTPGLCSAMRCRAHLARACRTDTTENVDLQFAASALAANGERERLRPSLDQANHHPSWGLDAESKDFL